MAQTILSSKKSTNGSPYAFYTVAVTPSDRTSTAVKLSVTVKAHLQYSESYMGSGIVLTAGLYVGGSWHEFTLKASSTTWSGTTVYTASTSITVSGLSSSTASLTGIQFRVLKTSGGSGVTTGGYLSATSCNDITVPTGNAVSGFDLDNQNINLGDSAVMTIYRIVSTNYHKIVATFGSNTHTFTSNAGTSAVLPFTAETFDDWFLEGAQTMFVTLTVTTYDADGTSLGTVKQFVAVKRKCSNVSLYVDDEWKPATSQLYIDGEWVNSKHCVYDGEWK